MAQYVTTTTNGTQVRVMQNDRLRLYAKFINHQVAAFAILFELITGVKPPKLKDVLRMQ